MERGESKGFRLFGWKRASVRPATAFFLIGRYFGIRESGDVVRLGDWIGGAVRANKTRQALLGHAGGD